MGAHRVAYTLGHGAIPAGLMVMHRCDNPPCCNPAHLTLGTHADNMADMAAKGRTPEQVGSKGHNAKLTEADIIAIREGCAHGIPQKVMREKYGLSAGSICDIVNCVTWTHVPDPGIEIRAERKRRRDAELTKLTEDFHEAVANFDVAAWLRSIRRSALVDLRLRFAEAVEARKREEGE